MHRRPIRALTLLLPALPVLLPFLTPLPARAAPAVGFHEEWPGTSLKDWGGGSLYDNPGTGGVDGAGDGFLRFWTPTPYSLGTVNMTAPYQGDWIAAGVTAIQLSINDVGAADALAIHCVIGNAYNVWQYNVAFVPPHNQWKEFTVDLTASGDFKRIVGTGTLAECLSDVDRLHFRHDLAPYIHTPDPIQADVGIDHLVLTTRATAARPTTWGRIKRLYR
jgi:hypothetical protein